MTHPADLGVVELSDALGARELSSVELVRACLDRIDELDSVYESWVRVYPDRALEQARQADARRQGGAARGPLDGVPVGLKDVISAADYPLTGGRSAVLAGNIAAEDSAAWARLRAAGMILLGHLACGEFACGTWGRNPWGPDFSPGGSSSGSGAALATRTVPATLGTDTRGSIRNPCAQNGVTGVKPTFGLVSTRGMIPLSVSYDIVGPMARSAADCSAMMSVLVDRPGTRPLEPRAGATPLAGRTIGIPRFAEDELAAGVAGVLERFAAEMTSLGATIVPFDRLNNPLEDNDGRRGGYKTIIGAEAAALHDGLADRWELFRAEFRSIFPPLLDRDGTAVQYVDAQRKRTALATTWRALFSDLGLDAVAEPGNTGEILRMGYSARDPALRPRLYGTWSDTNFPVVCLPGGLSHVDSGPVGLQLIGLPHTEAELLQIAVDYQAHTDHHQAEPPGLTMPAEASARSDLNPAEANSAEPTTVHPGSLVLPEDPFAVLRCAQQ